MEITAAVHGDPPLNVAVAHAAAPDDARMFLVKARMSLKCRQAFTTDLGLGITARLGPRTTGLVAYPTDTGILSLMGMESSL